MIDCDVTSLVQAAACFRCIPGQSSDWVSLYLLCQWANGSDCTPPETPVIDSTVANTEGEMEVNWTSATDPDQDFIIYWGLVSGGPYTGSTTFAANLRTGTIFDAAFLGGTTWYVVVVARNSDTCTASSEETSPSFSSLLDALEYYPMIESFDGTSRVFSGHEKDRYNYDAYRNDIWAALPSILEDPSGYFEGGGTVYITALYISPNGRLVGNQEYITSVPTDFFDIEWPAVANPNNYSLMLTVRDALGLFHAVTGITAAKVAAGWVTYEEGILITPVETNIDYIDKIESKGIEYGLWHCNNHSWVWNAGYPIPIVAGDYTTGVNAAIGHGWEQSAVGTKVLSSMPRTDLAVYDDTDWDRTFAVVFRPELNKGTNSPVLHLRGINVSHIQINYTHGTLPNTLRTYFSIHGTAVECQLNYTDATVWVLAVARISKTGNLKKVMVRNLTTGVEASNNAACPVLTAWFNDSEPSHWAQVALQLRGNRIHNESSQADIERCYIWKRYLSDVELTELINGGLLWEPSY